MTKKTQTKIITLDGQRIKVQAEYSTDHGYFSLTGSVWETLPNGQFSKEPDACGQVTKEILAAFPELSDLAVLHLSNTRTGEPLHAVANGWYWLVSIKADGTPRERVCVPLEWVNLTGQQRAAHYLNVDNDTFADIHPTAPDDMAAEKLFIDRVNTLRPGWQAAAEAALVKYGLTI